MSVKDPQSHFDQAKAEAFAGKVLTALNNGEGTSCSSRTVSLPTAEAPV